jgi:hypothetical protein
MGNSSTGDNAEWEGVPLEKIALWRALFNVSPAQPTIDALCPICAKRGLHKYYDINKENFRVIRGEQFRGEGSLWEWCEYCHHYEHLSVYVPSSWTFTLPIVPNLLRHDPSHIAEVMSSLRSKAEEETSPAS